MNKNFILQFLIFFVVNFFSFSKISADEFTIRYSQGEGNGASLFDETKTHTTTESVHLKFETWGIGLAKYSGTGCRDNYEKSYASCNYELRKKPYYRAHVNAINYSYTLGKNIFLTFKRNLFAQGHMVNLHHDRGTELEMHDVNFSYHNARLPLLFHSIQFGFRLSKLEIIIEKDYSSFLFTKENGYCFGAEWTGVDVCDRNKEIFNAGGVTLIGLGIVF